MTVSEHNVFRVYNGLDLPPVAGEVMDFRAILGLPPETVIVGCAGRFSPQKGFDLLPDVLSRLPKHIHVVHAGAGEFEQAIKSELRASAEADRIHFMGYQEDMAPFFRGIDVFLLCSRNEGMANVLNEALSHGKPAVSTRVPGSEELLAHGKYGILVDVNDAQGMSEAIAAIVEREKMYEPAELRQWIAQEFSLQRMIDETKRLFFGAKNLCRADVDQRGLFYQ